MKKTKTDKGITLIALIITIVVLLILAVVTIGAIRESSIITHAQNASDDYTTAQEKEQLQLALSEWQLQKNTSGNKQTFKATVKSSLGESANVTGSDNGPLTITFIKTGKTYKLSQDGTIGESAKLTGTDLEKYIFGDNLKGRDLTEIIDMDEGTFTDAKVQFLTCGFEEVINDIEILASFYIKNNDITYKFKFTYGIDTNEFKTTQPYYGLTKIEVAGERVGKTVSYDKKTWTILYDDATNGLQMISNEVYKYNGNKFYLGYEDSLITNWNSLNTETDEFKLADLDGNKKIDTYTEKIIYSYNNAITTLNIACENLFKKNGNYKNSNIVDVRCVGSNPISKNAENTTLYCLNLGGKVKGIDYNYVTDFDRMVALGINQSDDEYWLASRYAYEVSDDLYFAVREGTRLGDLDWENISDVKNYEYRSLRPVITLSSNVQLQANETGTTDYVLN